MSYDVKPEDCDHPPTMLAFKVERVEVRPGYVMVRQMENSEHCGKCGKPFDLFTSLAKEAS